MAVQNNNMLLLDLTRGTPRTISSADDLVLTPNSLDLAAGGSVADIQAPTVNVGTENTGSYTNTSILVGTTTSSLYLNAATITVGSTLGVGVIAENGSGSSLSAGTIVAEKSSSSPTNGVNMPYVTTASANASPTNGRSFAGVVVETIADGLTGRIATVPGMIVPVTFDPTFPPVTGDRGKPVYLSKTAGIATMSPPTGTDYNVQIIGYVINTSAQYLNNYWVQLNPQLVAVVP